MKREDVPSHEFVWTQATALNECPATFGEFFVIFAIDVYRVQAYGVGEESAVWLASKGETRTDFFIKDIHRVIRIRLVAKRDTNSYLLHPGAVKS